MGRFEENSANWYFVKPATQQNLSGSTHTSLLISLLCLPQCTNVFLKCKLGESRTLWAVSRKSAQVCFVKPASQQNLSGSTHTSLLISLVCLLQCTNAILKRKLGQARTLWAVSRKIRPTGILLNPQPNKI